MRINLGDLVRDQISGFQGVAVGRTEWLYGCVRITVAARGLDKDGKPFDSQTFDEDQCEIVENGSMQAPSKDRTGGPRPNAPRREDPRR